MSDPRPGTVGSVLDAYRADAAERESLLRTLEQRNRVLEVENAMHAHQLLLLREADGLTYSLGGFAGACLFGCADAIDRGATDAAVVWGSLVVLFVGARAILRVYSRGKRP